jgi:benzoyl-CoA reductase/2-hydroxyglutaryl-CoA dehydratase subunit BcrC/BadD/HgdB
MGHILSEDAFRKIIEVYNKTATTKNNLWKLFQYQNVAEIKKIKSLPRRYENL